MNKYGTAEFMYRQMEAFLMALTCLTNEQKKKLANSMKRKCFRNIRLHGSTRWRHDRIFNRMYGRRNSWDFHNVPLQSGFRSR